MEKISLDRSKQNLAKVQQIHGDVRSLLGLALDCDEKGEHAEAVQLYEQVAQLIRGALSHEMFDSDRRSISNVLERLQRHLESVDDRLNILKQKKPSLWSSLVGALNSFTEKSLGGPVWDDPRAEDPAETDDSILLPHAPPPIGSSVSSAPVVSRSKPLPENPPRPQGKPTQQPAAKAQPAEAPKRANAATASNSKVSDNVPKNNDAALQTALKSIDTKLKEAILNEIIQDDTGVEWDDVVGLGEAKRTLEESVVLPLVRPDLYRGLRTPPRGVLLYGPPGNGKTMIAKALARRGKARFFCVSASVLTSKWLGEGEKLVKALFLIARYVQPAVIFVDEIDSLLSARKGDEHEASRRLKTEFLVQMDGAMTSSAEQVLVLAATNRPFDLDEAILRRLVKRIYVPLPDAPGREAMISQLLKSEKVSLTAPQIQQLVNATQNMSYSDLKALCAEAAMSPLRELSQAELLRIDPSQIRPISHRDFVAALQRIRPSTDSASIGQFAAWTTKFGVAS